MNPAVQVLLVTTPAERTEAFGVRIAVFIDEQGVPADLELDELDATADHFLARVNGRPAGAGRLVPADQAGLPGGTGVPGGAEVEGGFGMPGEVGLLGRLAVLPATRGTGLGVALVEAIEERARQRGLAMIELHAQTHARGFYDRLGYQAEGEEYLEAGIPHISMRKKL
jgi:predicted GNAT family N-acyltransferase